MSNLFFTSMVVSDIEMTYVNFNVRQAVRRILTEKMRKANAAGPYVFRVRPLDNKQHHLEITVLGGDNHEKVVATGLRMRRSRKEGDWFLR